MTRFILVLFIAGFSISSFADPSGDKKTNLLQVESLKILVLDAETEEPIPAAKVKINENSLEAYTDFDGFIDFKNLRVGSYDIEVSFISYQKERLESIQVDNTNNQLVIKLRP
jgi:hypothetical protein